MLRDINGYTAFGDIQNGYRLCDINGYNAFGDIGLTNYGYCGN
jgi:hypothetical protein